MGVVTDALDSEGDNNAPADERTEATSTPRDPFANGASFDRWEADAGTIATGLTILKLLGDLIQ